MLPLMTIFDGKGTKKKLKGGRLIAYFTQKLNKNFND
jgi:hypothetical protein